jgi:hypothetical protein
VRLRAAEGTPETSEGRFRLTKSCVRTMAPNRAKRRHCLNLADQPALEPIADRDCVLPSVYIGVPRPAEHLVHLFLDTQYCSSMPHQLCVPVKHEYEATEDRLADLWENCREVVRSSVDVNPVVEGSLFSSMAMYSRGRQAGEDNESLTEMTTESTTTEPYHPNDATHQKM